MFQTNNNNNNNNTPTHTHTFMRTACACACSCAFCLRRYACLTFRDFLRFAHCVLLLSPHCSSMLALSGDMLECFVFHPPLPPITAPKHQSSSNIAHAHGILASHGIPRHSATDGIPPAPGCLTLRHNVDRCDIAT